MANLVEHGSSEDVKTSPCKHPAPVVAAALGYQDETAERHRFSGGGTWSRYTALPR